MEFKVLGANGSEKLSYVGTSAAIVLGLYLSSLHSYLLFHSLIEIITVAIALALFSLTWNTRSYLTSSYLRLVGVGYAFISLIDLLHTLAYKGMGVFPGDEANLPTQLWVAARYVQAVTLFVAPLLVERRLSIRAILLGYAATVSGLVALVYSGNFPDCFIEGTGLTAFKIGSEYAISAVLLASIYLLYRKRNYFNDRVFLLTAISIACTVLSELSFTAYLSVYGGANMLGHFAKLAAYYLLYQAILVTGLKEPFDLIFRDLKRADESLRKAQETLEEKVRARTAELRTSEERYRSLIGKVQTAIVLHDGQGRILNSNPLAEELLGLAADRLLGKSPRDPDWHFLREDGAVLPVAEYPVSLVFATGQPVRNHVLGIAQPHRANVAWVLVNAEPEYDGAGKITSVVVSFVDITERKQVEAEKEQYYKFFMLSTDAMCIADPFGCFRQVNPALVQLTGYSGSELLSRPFLDFVLPEDRQRTVDEMALQVKVRPSMNFENRYMRKDGSAISLSWTAYFDIKDGVTYATARDITESKRAQDQIRALNSELEQRVRERTAQLEAAVKELETFSYSVSHDLRAPLRAIDGFSKALIEDYGDKFDDTGKHFLQMLGDNTERMGNLIDDILGFSRMSRRDLAATTLDMAKLAQEVIEELRGSAPGRNFRFVLGALPPTRGDRVMIRQVMVNLLSNAIKFTRPRSEAVIEVGGAAEAEENIYYVKDNGVGFDMHYADKLFDVFQRLHLQTEFEGTGVGLAIVKRIIERHGGRVWAEGTVGEGATFHFSLPRI